MNDSEKLFFLLAKATEEILEKFDQTPIQKLRHFIAPKIWGIDDLQILFSLIDDTKKDSLEYALECWYFAMQIELKQKVQQRMP